MHPPIKPIFLIGSVLALAACSSKRDANIAATLPPPGGSQSGEGFDRDGNYTGPGSQTDLRRVAGSDRVLFDLDSYMLDASDRQTLDRQAVWLAQYSSVQVTIEGHCDERGTRDYNLALGERRANAAKNYLAGRGVSSLRMNVVSYGKERPEVLGSDEIAWAQNRRAVTLVIR